MEVQDIIKQRRLELGLSIRKVAQALGVAPSTVSRYESSDIQNMGIDKIEALARVLHCSPVYLMGWDDNPNLLPQSVSTALTDAEAKMLAAFRSLNPAGQQKLLERAGELHDLGFNVPTLPD